MAKQIADSDRSSRTPWPKATRSWPIARPAAATCKPSRRCCSRTLDPALFPAFQKHGVARRFGGDGGGVLHRISAFRDIGDRVGLEIGLERRKVDAEIH